MYDGSVTAVDSVKEDVQETKVVYRGWKVMPFIIGNAIILSFTVLNFLLLNAKRKLSSFGNYFFCRFVVLSFQLVRILKSYDLG